MKKLLIIPILLLSILCNAQFTKGGGMFLKTGGGFMTAPTEPAVEYDDEVDSYISGLSTALSATTLGRLNTFVVALKDSLNISTLDDVFDVMYVFANETQEAALRNLVERDHDGTAVGSPAFAAYEGFTGDGTAAYINTDYSAYYDSVNYTRNNASIGLYIRNNVSEEKVDVGARAGAVDIIVYSNYPSLGTVSRINVDGPRIDAANSSSVGFFIVTRNGSAMSNQVSYKNKTTPTQTASGSTNTVSAPTVNLYILALNNAGTAGDFSTKQVSLMFAGKHITTAMRDGIVDCFEAYMDSNSKGIL